MSKQNEINTLKYALKGEGLSPEARRRMEARLAELEAPEPETVSESDHTDGADR